jgi:hypothetical protein
VLDIAPAIQFSDAEMRKRPRSSPVTIRAPRGSGSSGWPWVHPPPLARVRVDRESLKLRRRLSREAAHFLPNPVEHKRHDGR